MSRVRKALNLIVCFGALMPALTGCAGMGGMGSTIMNLVLGLGMAVGVYYLTEALK